MFLCLSAGAQIVIVPREKLEGISNPKLSENASSLKFESMMITAEPMSEDDGVKEFTYPFRNIGSDTLRISRIVSTCSCAQASCRDLILSPGAASQIKVSYNPKGHPGRFERRIFVYIDRDESPAAVLRLVVNVDRGADMSGLYPISMGNIRVRRNEISFTRGEKGVEACVFMNVGEKPLQLQCETALLPPCLTFRTEPQTVAPGQEGRIIIGYDPQEGNPRATMPVVIKGLGVPPTQAAITVNINEK